MSQRKGREIIGNVIDEMIDYTAYHFKTEEDYFAELSFPNTIAHKKEHRDFVEKAQELQEKHRDGSLLITIDTMFFLQDWLVNHIQGSDKEYTAIFNANGLN